MKHAFKIAYVGLVFFFAATSMADETRDRLASDSPESNPNFLSDQGVSVIIDQVSDNRIATLLYEPGKVKASAISFVVKYPQGFKADATDCLADLASSLQGGCKVHDDEVRVILFNPTNDAISATTLGSLIFAPSRSTGSRRAAMAADGTAKAFALDRVDIGEAP